MNCLIIFFITLLSTANSTDEYNIDEIYEKVQLDGGTLDDEGDDIDFILVKTELKQGEYEIEITDGPGDLYEVKGTDYFLKFRSYYGYAGYGNKGLLIIGSSSWSSKFIKYDD